ncbi:MAG: YrdB family protein [Dehalococcoidia bacterium]
MAVKSANLALRFLLELGALAALAYWGFTALDEIASSIVLGLGAPISAALIWGTFASPAAPKRLAGPMRLLLELAIFGLAALALAAAGQPAVAIIFGLIAAFNSLFLYLLDQR